MELSIAPYSVRLKVFDSFSFPFCAPPLVPRRSPHNNEFLELCRPHDTRTPHTGRFIAYPRSPPEPEDAFGNTSATGRRPPQPQSASDADATRRDDQDEDGTKITKLFWHESEDCDKQIGTEQAGPQVEDEKKNPPKGRRTLGTSLTRTALQDHFNRPQHRTPY